MAQRPQNRRIDPGGELRVHRQWFPRSAMDELLGVDFAVAEKDRLYRCLDRLPKHKRDWFVWLRRKWADLFHADFEVLLYDLTSTYFEGEMEQRHPQGGMDGDTSDRTTPRGFQCGSWIAAFRPQAILAEMRDPARRMFYLAGTPKSKIGQYEKKWLAPPWRKVGDTVEVKLGTATAQGPGHAPQPAQTRSVTHADGRGQNGSGPSFRFVKVQLPAPR